MSDSLLRTILPPSLVNQPSPGVVITPYFTRIVEAGERGSDRLRTPNPAKNLNEFYQLVGNVIGDYERRAGVTDDAKVHFTEEDPDYPKEKSVIVSYSLVKREPGTFSQGKPGEGNVRNLNYITREEIEDEENPGYKRAILGYIHDNEVKFTIWAKTNKVANERALWFEGLMQEYSWYFTSQGVSRCLFQKREKDFVSEVNDVKMYGRPIHYFLRTETLITISQKKIELIEVESGLAGLT
jgi:hypothetical protein